MVLIDMKVFDRRSRSIRATEQSTDYDVRVK